LSIELNRDQGPFRRRAKNHRSEVAKGKERKRIDEHAKSKKLKSDRTKVRWVCS